MFLDGDDENISKADLDIYQAKFMKLKKSTISKALEDSKIKDRYLQTLRLSNSKVLENLCTSIHQLTGSEEFYEENISFMKIFNEIYPETEKTDVRYQAMKRCFMRLSKIAMPDVKFHNQDNSLKSKASFYEDLYGGSGFDYQHVIENLQDRCKNGKLEAIIYQAITTGHILCHGAYKRF